MSFITLCSYSMQLQTHITMFVLRHSSGSTTPSVRHHLRTTTAVHCTAEQHRRPVGIFIDLDNVVPHDAPYTRQSLAQWIRPFRAFADSVGNLDSFQAFANQHTNKYDCRSREQRQQQPVDQEWWGKGLYLESDPQEDFLFPGALVQTGRDQEGVLRCGVCGARINVSKKDRQQGLTEKQKLEKHMRMLHDREQTKRKKYLNQLSSKRAKRYIQGKDGERMMKYEASQVGLGRAGLSPGRKNDLIRILKEEGVYCSVVPDVDLSLMKRAREWLETVLIHHQQQQQESRNELFRESDNDRSCQNAAAVLVVVSRDSDFGPLLTEARQQGLVTVTADPTGSRQQTLSLIRVSDVVLLSHDIEKGSLDAEPITEAGRCLLQTVIGSPLIFQARLDTEEDHK